MIWRQIHGRESRHVGIAANIAKTFAQIVVFWGFFLFIMPAVISWIETLTGWDAYRFTSRGSQIAGIALFTLASCLGFTSGMVMAVAGRGTPLPLDCPTRLVVAGPYRYVRNPMVIAGISQGIAIGIWLGSWPVIVYSLCGAALWNWLVRPWEEHDLQLRLGEPYVRYQQAVRCWIPRLRPYRINL